MKGLSIILPTFNSFEKKKYSIKYTLSTILQQQIDFSYEIIIVDNGSKDNTINYLNTVKNGYDIHIHYCNITGNRSCTRNLGVKKSKYDSLLFIDDDTILTDEFAIKKAYQSLKMNAFCCGAKRYWMKAEWNPEELDNALNERNIKKYFENNSFLPKGISRESGYRDLQEFSFIANFGLISKKDFEKLGGFNEVLFPSRREDVALMYDAVLNGLEFINLHEICSVTHLTHQMVAQSDFERIEYHNKFRKYEESKNYYFRVNALFGVNEGDNGEVLQRIS